jgi:hypothetical protein
MVLVITSKGSCIEFREAVSMKCLGDLLTCVNAREEKIVSFRPEDVRAYACLAHEARGECAVWVFPSALESAGRLYAA